MGQTSCASGSSIVRGFATLASGVGSVVEPRAGLRQPGIRRKARSPANTRRASSHRRGHPGRYWRRPRRARNISRASDEPDVRHPGRRTKACRPGSRSKSAILGYWAGWVVVPARRSRPGPERSTTESWLTLLHAEEMIRVRAGPSQGDGESRFLPGIWARTNSPHRPAQHGQRQRRERIGKAGRCGLESRAAGHHSVGIGEAVGGVGLAGAVGCRPASRPRWSGRRGRRRRNRGAASIGSR